MSGPVETFQTKSVYVILIGRIWDALDDPLFGYLTDRTRSRWGRRRGYLLFGAIPLGLVFAMLWSRPPTNDATR